MVSGLDGAMVVEDQEQLQVYTPDKFEELVNKRALKGKKGLIIGGAMASAFMLVTGATIYQFKLKPELNEVHDSYNALLLTQKQKYEQDLSEQQNFYRTKLSEIDRNGYTRGLCHGFNVGTLAGYIDVVKRLGSLNFVEVKKPHHTFTLTDGYEHECNPEIKYNPSYPSKFERYFPEQKLTFGIKITFDSKLNVSQSVGFFSPQGFKKAYSSGQLLFHKK